MRQIGRKLWFKATDQTKLVASTPPSINRPFSMTHRAGTAAQT